MKTIAFCTGLLLLAACSAPGANGPAENTTATANLADADITEVPDESASANMGDDDSGDAGSPVADWTGKWIGVEGLALDIAPGSSLQTRKLTITLLDGTNSYEGTVKDDVITFERGGKIETIRAGSGAETGLKYLADKQNCLIIKSGEGFCRG